MKEGARRFRKAQDGGGRCKKVQVGARRSRKIKGSEGRFRTPVFCESVVRITMSHSQFLHICNRECTFGL